MENFLEEWLTAHLPGWREFWQTNKLAKVFSGGVVKRLVSELFWIVRRTNGAEESPNGK